MGQVTFMAEHTGCDGARLRAPLALHGSEASLLQGQEPRGLRFDFACETILVSVVLTFWSALPH